MMNSGPKVMILASAVAVLPIDTVIRQPVAYQVVVGESMDDEDDRRPDAGPLYDPTPEEVEAARAYLEARRERLRAEGRDPDKEE